MFEGEEDSPLPSIAVTITWWEERAPLFLVKVRVVLILPP